MVQRTPRRPTQSRGPPCKVTTEVSQRSSYRLTTRRPRLTGLMNPDSRGPRVKTHVACESTHETKHDSRGSQVTTHESHESRLMRLIPHARLMTHEVHQSPARESRPTRPSSRHSRDSPLASHDPRGPRVVTRESRITAGGSRSTIVGRPVMTQPVMSRRNHGRRR